MSLSGGNGRDSGSSCSTAAEGFQKAIQVLRGGGMIGILSDQHAGDHGLWTPFFHRLASTSPLPGLLRQTHRRGARRSVTLHRRPSTLARMVFTSRFDAPDDECAIAHRKDKCRHRTADSPRAGRLVLGAQPLENAEAESFVEQLQTRPLRPTRNPWKRVKAFSHFDSRQQWLGDSIISMPAVHAIKAGRPDAHITIVAPEKLLRSGNYGLT